LIFKSAAKSQGAKAPRKTKANPEPLQAIRQGTDFAIAQLEAVYTSRRKTEQEIKRLDNRIAAARTNGKAPESIARVLVSPTRGRVTARYALAGLGWSPSYDISWTGTPAPWYSCLAGSAGHLLATCSMPPPPRWQSGIRPTCIRLTPPTTAGWPVFACRYRKYISERVCRAHFHVC